MVEIKLPCVFPPVAATLTSFRCTVPGNGSANFPFFVKILAVLTSLTSISVVHETVSLAALWNVLRDRAPLVRLSLLERVEAGNVAVEWDELVEFVRGVRVEQLVASPVSWTELWR